MSRTIRILCVALITLLPSPQTAAAGQEIPGSLNLNGLWQLTEYGAHDSGEDVIVHITHSGSSVVGRFVSGSTCFDGNARPSEAFIAQLTVHPTLSPTGQLTAPSMWVCSGDPDLVKRCAGSGVIKPIYKTTFTNAAVDPDYIEGVRVTQGVRDCSLDASENGTARFSLRRLSPCEFEDRQFRDAENALHDLRNSIVGARVAMRTTIDAARIRFGTSFEGKPLTTLDYPYDMLDVSSDPVEIEALFLAYRDLIASREWADSRFMAEQMRIIATPPLMQAERMMQEMYRIERLAPDTQTALYEYKNRRLALQKCQQAQQQ